MQQFIDLQRRFREVTDSELEEPEQLGLFGDQDLPGTFDWADILAYPRVVLLAEAGSGKTWEMQEQARRLGSTGRPAFFLPLESLDRESPTDILSVENERSFHTWLADDQSPAWFFLDSVDELKLTQGHLERALKRLAKYLHGHLGHAHIIISSRPSDWRAETDFALVVKLLPIVPQTAQIPDPEEVFLAPLRYTEKLQPTQEDGKISTDVPKTIVLLPLNPKQVTLFATNKGLENPAALTTELNKRDAWTFARRPLDLEQILAVWKSTGGKLGTRTEQHEANVCFKLQDDPERPDRGILSDQQAQCGAGRLALALALTRTRTILAPGQSLDNQRRDGVLNSAEVLPDWSPEQRQTLLRRALFDPATYGRVRFHHRSVQEYLAACRLRYLRDRGMSVCNLFRLLFGERYDKAVVLPSMAPISAWLALWDADVRRELMQREPEVLLTLGDPQTLPMDARADLLRAFVSAYGSGLGRGIDLDIGGLRRLAHPDLTVLVRELWADGPANEDIRELLLKMIWQGSLHGCADIAEAAVMNTAIKPYHRIIAMRALAVCGDTLSSAQRIAKSILAEPHHWPDRVVYGVAPDLFPLALSVDELLCLVERTSEPQTSIGGFAWALREIGNDVDPWSEAAIRLRDQLARLIWDHRSANGYWPDLTSRFGYTAPALALLCDRQLTTQHTTGDTDALLRCSIIVVRVRRHDTGIRKEIEHLQTRIRETPAWREAAFWQDLELMDSVTPKEKDRGFWFPVEHGRLFGYLTESDRDWLEPVLAEASKPRRRSVALEALLQIWNNRERPVDEIETMKAAVQDDAGLTEVIAKRAAPPQRSPGLERSERNERRRNCVAKGRERQRLEQWQQWREGVCADPETAFGPEKRDDTVGNLYRWLRTHPGPRSVAQYDSWNEAAIRNAFSAQVAELAIEAFKAVWRSRRPTMWSERPPKERGNTLWVWIHGLCGLSAETSSPGWATRLSAEEAKVAATYATVEINGFPNWLPDLAEAHPTPVDIVLGRELSAQLALAGKQAQLPILQDLSHADTRLKRLFAPRLLAGLKEWPTALSNDTAAGECAHLLNQVIDLLGETLEGEERRRSASLCQERLTAEPAGPLATAWLRGLFRLDSLTGTEALESILHEPPEPERTKRAVSIFVALFGDRDGVPVRVVDSSRRTEILGRLVRCAYRYIRPEEDQEHEGMFEPNRRDDAQHVRSHLLSSLLDTPGAEAYRIIVELADDPLFAHFPDGLRLLARERAAADAEFERFTPADLVTLEKRLEAPPHDRDGLFQVMMDRLDDLQHYISHHDFTDRVTLRTINDEIEMQRTLARRLSDAAKRTYIVTREEEVADRKSPDIRLATPGNDHRAAIEVKIADKRWSIRDFEVALKHQLVGQYLRHDRCKAGVLLLTYNGEKPYWQHPETRKQLNFGEVIAYLSNLARAIEREKNHEVRLAVCGLDLRDPKLAPAHR